MSKQTTKDNFRVEVFPDNRYCNYRRKNESEFAFKERSAENDRALCEEIQSEIKRHVDGCYDVSINYDTIAVCEHCGYAWGEDSLTYNGGCCSKDQEDEDAREAAAKEQTK